MGLRPDEISSLIKEQIKHFDEVIEQKDVGTVMTVGDGVSVIHGLDDAMLGELLAFPNDVYGMVMNLDEDSVGAVLLGSESTIKEGDEVCIHMGNVIPLDGVIKEGEGMVNQASLTGEAIPVAKKPGGYVYAGTVLEEGELLIEVKENSGTTKYEKIVAMIEETEKYYTKKVR